MIVRRFLALFLLVLLIPVMLLVGFAIAYRLGSPILFRQERIGKGGVPFKLVKFRTMIEAYDDYGVPLPDKDRATKLGRFLRKTSLDELPTLFNVVLGQMAFVGPRPLPTIYLKYYSARQNSRHDVLPGITGLAQVNGRNNISWDDKLEYDAKYVETKSFILDFSILIKTIFVVLLRKNVSKSGEETTTSFIDE